MEKIIPQSRKKYQARLDKLKGRCGLCNLPPDLNIIEYKYWDWAFNEFPYWKYNTMVVLKRHVKEFTDISAAELKEFQKILQEIEARYIESGVIGPESSFGMQLIMFWRFRPLNSLIKRPVSHIHLHICPEFQNAWEKCLDLNAWNFDMDLLKKRKNN